jgi:HD-GYP domain-containing protein (c-di-GMP phosphodiesterase class II)
MLAASQAAVLVRAQDSSDRFMVAAGHNVDPELLGGSHSNDMGIVGRVMRTGEPVVVREHRRYDRAIVPTHGPGGAAAVPVKTSTGVDGSLWTLFERRSAVTEQELSLMRMIADLVACAIEHARARRRIPTGAVQQRVTEIATSIARRDGYTGRHSADVGGLGLAVGHRLGVDPVELIELQFAAQLHDVGKIEVPDSILRCSSGLTERQWRIMRRHPVVGADMLAPVPGLQAVANIVRFHHERYDGRGYPIGLSGNRIPLPSRIIAVCDAYLAMTSDRPYRRAMPVQRAVAELEAGAGTQFDPEVVRALLDTIERMGRRV